jgi:hypothetical protein
LIAVSASTSNLQEAFFENPIPLQFRLLNMHLTLNPTIFFLAALLCPSPILPLVLLPKPPGFTNVQLTTMELVDYSRVDALAPCCHKPRKLMISVFAPAACLKTISVPYMPPATASYYDSVVASLGIPKGTFASIRLQVCPAGSFLKSSPLALFSPGLGASRLIYSSYLQWIAATGITVVSIDHTYEGDVVEFPDGSVIKGNVTSDGQIPQVVAIRGKDVSFVLSQLSNSTITNLLPLSCPYPSGTKAAIFGHSLGGATAGNALVEDKRFIGGLNMDGSMFAPATTTPSKKPFLIFANQAHNQTDDASWAVFWHELKGWKLQLQVNGTKHLSYSDFPILAKLFGIDPVLVAPVGDLIGTVDGLRVLQILRTYVGAFLAFVLKGQNAKVLQGPSKDFPDVFFRNSSGIK